MWCHGEGWIYDVMVMGEDQCGAMVGLGSVWYYYDKGGGINV